MRSKAIALLAVTLVAGCGFNTPARPTDASIGVNPSGTFATQIATPPPGSFVSTDSVPTVPSTDSATDSLPTVPATDSPATDSPVATPVPTVAPTAAPLPTPAPTAVPLPIGSLPPDPSSTPTPVATLPPQPTPTPATLPDGLSYQVVRQWTTGWSIFGTKKAHVDLMVNYFPSSFFAPAAKVIVEIAWTKSGAIVNTTDYGPWTLTAPNSVEATFDAPVSSDGEQIQLLPSN